MALSNSLISQFVKTTNDNTTTTTTSTLIYGTARVVGDTAYVLVDGSEQLIPMNSTATVSDGDRVTMTISDHTATVTGNLTDVSASSGTVSALVGEVATLSNSVVSLEDSVVTIKDSILDIEGTDFTAINSQLEYLNSKIQIEDSELVLNDSYLSAITSSIEALNSVIQITDSGVVISGTSVTIEGSSVDLSGLDIDAVNSVVDIVDSYLKVEDNVLYINGIEAGWIDVGSLSADVANINTLLAGSAGVTTLQSIHITSENVVFQDAVIDDAAINTLSASKLTAGIIYTNSITLQSDVDDMGLYITKSLIAMYDSNDIQRLQAGMSSEEEGYNFVIWDSDGTQLFNATGITASGIPSETIVNEHISNNAAISGEKLDITSVVNSINEDGNVQVDYSNVKIDNTTLSAVYTTLIEAADFTQALQTEFTVENGKITASLWQTTFNDAISIINDEFTTLYADLDGITASVGKLTSTLDYTGYIYRNYALTSGNYAEGEDNVWKPVSTTDQETIANYYDIYTCDGYTRVECITSNSQTYKIYIPLSDDFDNTVQHTFTVKLRLSNAVAILMGYRYYTNDASSGYFGYWTKSADNFTDGEWVTISTTLTPNTSRTYTHFGIGLQNVNVAGYYVDIAYVMEEEGSEAHDWEPAPEDYGKAMTSLYSQMGSLTVSLNNITARVDEAYVNAEDALDLYSQLELTVSGITSTVSAVLDLSYRNYALTSGNYTVDSDLSNWYSTSSSYTTYYTLTAYDGYVELYCTSTTTTARYFYLSLAEDKLVGDGSTKYTITFKIRRSVVSSAMSIRANYGTATASQSISTIDASNFTEGEWSIVSVTFTPTVNRVYKGVGFYLSSSYGDCMTADEYIDIAYVIVSEGEESPDEWCPAPEDYGFTDTLVNQYTTIQQLSDSIKLAVMVDEETGYLYLGTATDTDRIVFTVSSDNLTITETGILKAVNGEFSGSITATDGYIGNWAISANTITSTGSTVLSYDNASTSDVLNGDDSTVYDTDTDTDSDNTSNSTYKRTITLDSTNALIKGSTTYTGTTEGSSEFEIGGRNMYITSSVAETSYYAKRSDTGYVVRFGVGQGGYNHGVFSSHQGIWLIYGDVNDRTIIRSKTNVVIRGGTNNPPLILQGKGLSTSNTGNAFKFLRTASDIDSDGNYYDATSSTTVLLAGGSDTTSAFIRSYPTYYRTYTTSAASYVLITSSGTFGRLNSSSSRYKHDIATLSNPDKSTQNGIELYDFINNDGVSSISANDSNSDYSVASSYAEDALSLLKLPVCTFKYYDGYITGQENFDYDKPILGFVAEDVAKICPECAVYQMESVFETDDNGDYVLNDAGEKKLLYERKTDVVENWDAYQMIPRIVYILQHQQKLIENLTEEVNNLRSSLSAHI